MQLLLEMPFKWLYKYTQREYKLCLRELTNQNVISVCWRLGCVDITHGTLSYLTPPDLTVLPAFYKQKVRHHYLGDVDSKLHVLLEAFCGPLSTKFRRRNTVFFCSLSVLTLYCRFHFSVSYLDAELKSCSFKYFENDVVAAYNV